MTMISKWMMAAAAGIAATGAFAVDPVEYYDPVGGTNATCSTYTEYAGQTDLSTGWHVVSGANTNEILIAVSGDVNLVLRDGAELVAMNGVYVIEGCSLTIWAQGASAVAGKLTATGAMYSSGIGGINHGPGGNVTINGGVVTATGNYGAGIGGGDHGAGVNVTINGGVVTATGGGYSAGIGGGSGGAGGTVAINGGTVTATGGYGGAAIGAGSGGSDNGSLDIAGGMLAGSVNGDKVNRVAFADRESLCRNTNGTTVRIEVCEHHDSDKNGFCDYCGKLCGPIPYYDTVGGTNAICSTCTEYADQTELSTGWYVVSGVITNDTRITVNGDVNLILCDNSELAAMGGVEVATVDSIANSLTIWAQSTNSVAGKLTATGGEDCSGIGGGNHSAGGNVTINGGVVMANGGWSGAGIGGGYNGAGGNVTINGGMVTAIGNSAGAGIGGGADRAGGKVTVNGGVVMANGGWCSAGIGGGSSSAGGTVTINGGMVTATAGEGAAGIGGGFWGVGGNVTINGGVVTAKGDRSGAAIGAGGGVSDHGSLVMASSMEVWCVEGDAVTLAGADERETYCRNTEGKAIWIASAGVGVLVGVGGGKTVFVPMTWLAEVVPESFEGTLEEYVCADAVNGRKVWECYVLGLDPKGTADFRITSFPMKADGTPDLAKIEFSPSKESWNLAGAEPVLEGRSDLGADAEWATVTDVGDPTSLRFFRVRVELP